MSMKCSLRHTNVAKPQVDGGNHVFAPRSQQLQRRTLQTAMLMLLAVAICCFPRNSMAQEATAAGSHGRSTASQAQARILIPAPLASSLDSKKLKTGDEVILKTGAKMGLTDGTTIPSGTRVIGHVTEAKARSKGDAQSSLAITFDKLSFPDGRTSVVSGVIRAVGPDLSVATDGGGGVNYSNNMSRTTYMPSVSAQPHSVPMLNEQSVGVLGIKHLSLDADGVLSSDSNSVKLDNGSQVLVQVEAPAGAQAVGER